MERTAMRIATVAALQNGGAAPWPTLAEAGIFDSRSDAIDSVTEEGNMPAVIVRTDEDRFATTNSSVTGQRAIEMRIECSIITGARDDNGDLKASWAETDAALEAFLDLMEYQVLDALFGASPWAMWWRVMFKPGQRLSLPVWTQPGQGRTRLAIRELTISFPHAAGYCFPQPINLLDATLDSDGAPVITATLPARLVAVFDKIDADGSGDFKSAMSDLRDALEAQRLPRSHAYEPMTSVRMTINNPSTPPSDQDPLVAVDAELTDTLPTP